MRHPDRGKLSHEVRQVAGRPTIVFVTVCSRNRESWLASPKVHQDLIGAWSEASAWKIGRYTILPDHIHLFAAPGEMELPLDNWVRFWKSQFSRTHGQPGHRWHPRMWDTRLRERESYDEKWEYVRNNPVRHGLVTSADDWPYQGELNVLDW